MFTPQHIILDVKQHAVDLYIEPWFGNHEFYSNASKYVFISLRWNSAVEIKPTFGIIDCVSWLDGCKRWETTQ